MILLRKYGVISTFLNTKFTYTVEFQESNVNDCGVHQIEVPRARKQNGFTLFMDAIILTMAQSMPILKIAKILDEHDTKIWRVIIYYVKKARTKEDFCRVSVVGIDETLFKL